VSAPSAQDLEYLRAAIRLSEAARRKGNMPYGAVLVAADGEVLASTENSIVTDRDVTAHAETNAFRSASKRFDARRFSGATMYASGEPCPMCSGAIMRLGLGRVLFGIRAATAMPYMPSASGVMPGSVACRDLLALAPHAVEVHGPLLEDEARVPLEALKARGAA